MKHTNNLPIPSTDENDGADGCNAVEWTFALKSAGKGGGGLCSFVGSGANGVGCWVIVELSPNVLLNKIGYVPIVIGTSRTGSSRQQSADPRIC